MDSVGRLWRTERFRSEHGVDDDRERPFKESLEENEIVSVGSRCMACDASESGRPLCDVLCDPCVLAVQQRNP